MEISERLLNDAGGWQVMKQARALHSMERVAEAKWEPPVLAGRVREGDKEYSAGLKVESRTNIENLCSCRDSRQRGMICAHSVAIGLELLKPHTARKAQVDVDETAPLPAKPAAQPLPSFAAENGDPLELFIILPPNLATAWEKNSLMVGAEAAIAGRRVLLSALRKEGVFRCSEGDIRVFAALRELAGGELPGMMMLPREKFLGLLSVMVNHPRVTFGKSAPARISGQGIRPLLDVVRQSDGSLRLKAELPADGALLAAGAQQPWILTAGIVQPIAPGLPAAYHDLLRREITLPPAQANLFLEREMVALRPAFECDSDDAALRAVAATPAEKVTFSLRIEGSLNHLAAWVDATQGNQKWTLAADTARTTRWPRDPAAEHAVLARLRQSGFTGPDASGQLTLKGEPRILAFFATELRRWEREGRVTIGARFQHVTRGVERMEPRLQITSSGESWFDLHFDLATKSGEHFSAAEIQRLLQGGQSHLRRRNGKVAVFDPSMLNEFQQVLQDCDPQQHQPGAYRIEQRHAAYLGMVASEQGVQVEAPDRWKAWAAAPRHLDRLRPVPLGSLETVLRPYQKHGVYWMNFLAENGLAGILADEMGLGKTVQTLAFLRNLGGRALIVCPSSLVYNWQREASRFTAERRVLAIEGPDRHQLFREPLSRADLVITSYALLRRDLDAYRGVEFSAVVLDEAQHIKNPESQNAQSACAIRARHRFALTGTPVENSVRDIWSLMHFLMPGYLGQQRDFRERFEKSILATPNGPEQQRLVKRLQPFVLRRLKKDVVKDLPDKIEHIAYCDLSTAQQAMYGELLTATRRTVADLAGEKNRGKAQIAVLTALLRLRQACCDLRLLGVDESRPEEASAKVGLLGELLDEAVDGGHRVLIFSQFVSMLHLLREWLEQRGTRFCYLDGATKDRAKEVDRFQTGTDPVFLISLKAGGVGLNLTAADTVVHFDPWWNPAAEAQATDRTHRIGQKSVVNSYKLIARGTIEEKIVSLQSNKLQLIGAMVNQEAGAALEHLTITQLEELLM